jgi:hypothetical protein
MLTCVNDVVRNIEFGDEANVNACFMAFPTSGRVYVWRNNA